MSTFKQILIAVAVIIFLSTYRIIWYYIKRFIFKPDIQQLMDARDIPGLLRALSYKKEKYDFNYIRTNAAIALGNIGDATAIDKLVERLNDTDRSVVKAAIQAIGQITLRCVRQPMFEAYQHRDQLRIQSLISTLQNIQLKATSPLKYAYRDSSELQLVVSTLGIISGSEAVDFLLNLLKESKDSGIKKIAVHALASTGDPRMTDALLKLLLNPAPYLRVTAAEILGNLKEKRAIIPLSQQLSAPNPIVRKAAAEALGKIGHPQAAGKMIYMLSDEHPECRKTAAAVLAGLGDKKWSQWVKGDDNDFNRLAGSGEPQTSDILIKALDNPKAIPALGTLGDKRAVDPLITKLKNDNVTIQKDAAKALGKLGDTKAVEPLIDLVTHKNAQVRREAAQALDKLGRSEWSKWVKGEIIDFDRLAQSKDPRVFDLLMKMEDNEKAIQALGTFGDKRAVEPLVKKLEHNDNKIKMAALKALETLGDKQAVEPIKKLLVHMENNIRRNAANALKKLDEPKWLDFISGNYDDFERLLHADDGYVVTESIKIIMDGLYSGNFMERKRTAKILIQLAANPPAELKNFWVEIGKKINTPHTDSHGDVDLNRSSDCTHDDYHSDTGIGLTFPKLPEHFKKK